MLNKYFDPSTGAYYTNPEYTEILKLDEMLNIAGIPHVTARMFDGWQVCYPDKRVTGNLVMDAIQHYGSYGNDENRLEIMGLLTPEEEEYDDVLGHLTAEEVFGRIKKHHDGEWDGYIESLSKTPSDNLHDETPEETSTDTTTNIPMTPEEFTKQMQEAFDVYYLEKDDEEVVHIVMDGIMCNLLRQLGYGEGVDIFNKTPMWYA